jgi:hypothetical protein
VQPIQLGNLPTYQELGGIRPEKNEETNDTLPNYYNSNLNTVPGSPPHGGGGGRGTGLTELSPQDISNHPIHQMAMEGASASQMKGIALRHGVDYADAGGRTPLMYAILGNQPKMCEMLLKLKANIDATDMASQSPLMWAAYQAKAEIIRILLK